MTESASRQAPSRRLHELVNKYRFVPNTLRWFVNLAQFRILSYYKDEATVALLKGIYREAGCQLQANEAYTVLSVARAHARLGGDMAEVGVYRGASARLICEVKGAKPLHLFDTFEGLPETGAEDPLFKEKSFSAGLERVRSYLAGHDGLQFHQGLFPATAGPVEDRTFCFVHLDVDLYQSTRDAIEFFYPRMVTGGAILSHDYAQAQGVRRAFDEYCEPRSIPVIELAESQCLVLKTGPSHAPKP